MMFGHLRSFRKTAESFQQVISLLRTVGEVDVYAHTWDIEDSVTASWWKSEGGPPPGNVNEDEVRKIIQPVSLIIEPSRQFDDSNYQLESSIPIAGLMSMLHSQTRSFELMKKEEQAKGFSYDVVIKSRYDILYELHPDFLNQVKLAAAGDECFIPNSNPYEILGACCDVLAVCGRKISEAYFTFYVKLGPTINNYIRTGFRKVVPEVLLGYYLSSNEIGWKETEGIRLQILRLNESRVQLNSDRHFNGNLPLCFHKQTIESSKAMTSDPDIIKENLRRLIIKYAGWVLPKASPSEMQILINYFNGQKVSNLAPLRKLAAKSNHKIFVHSVIRDFLEMGIWNAQYDFLTRLRLAATLMFTTGHGSFYFRVLKKQTFG